MPWTVVAYAAVAVVSAYVSSESAKNSAIMGNSSSEADYIRRKAKQKYDNALRQRRNNAVNRNAREAYNALELNKLSASADEVFKKRDIQIQSMERRANLAVIDGLKGSSGKTSQRIGKKIEADEAIALWGVAQEKNKRSLKEIYSMKYIETARASGRDYSIDIVSEPVKIDVGSAAMTAGITSGIMSLSNSYVRGDFNKPSTDVTNLNATGVER